MTTPGPGPAAADPPAPVLLIEPAEGTPDVVTDLDALTRASSRIASGHGPIAVDTERASGYRYSQRAYLVQVRRQGSGTFLVDPVAVDDQVDSLIDALAADEWVLHAASQDLPCLADLGLRPAKLFDTELAGRLAGFERVALGTLVELLLGYRLEKGHGAADWSRRPLPIDWLNYAALDVELLIQLRDALEEELRVQGKLEWALEEFEALRTAGPPPPRKEPWRRTSGIHSVRTPRGLAAIRALWEARDGMARERDIAPGRVLPDSAIIQAASVNPADEQALLQLPVFKGRAQRRLAGPWMRALRAAAQLPKSELPDPSPPADGPPPANRWADKDPEAAARLAAARTALNKIAEENRLPVENLLQPDLLRRTCWQPPADLDTDTVAATLRAGHAREWQINLVVDAVSAALKATAG
ncbi:ribonuclease D [Actinokineospora sp. NBRC 105648]|uniref:ribonuclease D n=1 Tax=Actinokineospora sp. NBRC 105648 TaxID=3032206 RepID=UPI0024A3D3C5|nr:ribonuclease D [Actinokineospora sp. NBRC 105648]GLZ38786.1 ribonuclease D [Actinokineospora sp. NBRC 105648]